MSHRLRPASASAPATRAPTRIAGFGALILLVISIIQNTHAVHISFLGAHAWPQQSRSMATAALIRAAASRSG